MGSVESLVLEERSELRWEQFLAGRLQTDHSPLLTRWSRSQGFNVDPRGPAKVECIEAATELDRRRERAHETWSVVRPLFGRLSARLAEHDFVSLLADPEGVILWSAGGGRFRDHAEQVRLMAGAHWGEPVRGTNAIGTALLEQRPVTVLGCAHFERTNHQLVCYGHPIRDARGRIAGLLDVTSALGRADPRVRLAVATAVDGMEQLLLHHAWARHAGGLEGYPRLLQHYREPALLVSVPGVVRHGNAAARALLHGTDGLPALGLSWSSLEAAARGESLPPLHVAGRGYRVVVEPIGGPEALGYLVLLERDASPRRASLPTRERRTGAFARLHGHDARFEAVLERAARFAITDVPILLLAETGTGKDLLARAIHAHGRRREHPMMTINCGALAPELMASELFGYAGGAFTGALRQGAPGLLAHAAGGTLFLDEVAEMPPSLQVMLLRVLEDGTYTRVGEARARHTDVRLICATCSDLGDRVRRGMFRADLYYRIRGATLSLPALRERDDLFALAEGFVSASAQSLGRTAPVLSESVRAWMRHHRWPGNIRELRSTMEHATVLADDEIELQHLPFDVLDGGPTGLEPATPSEAGVVLAPVSRDEADAAVVRRAVDDAGGNLSEAARRLGVARSTLYRLLDRHGLR